MIDPDKIIKLCEMFKRKEISESQLASELCIQSLAEDTSEIIPSKEFIDDMVRELIPIIESDGRYKITLLDAKIGVSNDTVYESRKRDRENINLLEGLSML